MKLTKRDLVVRISEETGLAKNDVLEVIQRTLDSITQALANGTKVELRNFGVFEVKVRKARPGRNPRSPETEVLIPERSVVKFKAGKEMRGDMLRISTKAPGNPSVQSSPAEHQQIRPRNSPPRSPTALG